MKCFLEHLNSSDINTIEKSGLFTPNEWYYLNTDFNNIVIIADINRCNKILSLIGRPLIEDCYKYEVIR